MSIGGSRRIFRPWKHIDFRIGLIGGVVMGGIVFTVNYTSTADLAGSFTASLKQGAYTFLFGGVVMKLCETLSTSIRKRISAILLATLIPSLMAISLTFAVHSLKGTPKPVASTIPTALLVIPSTFVWAIRKRKTESLR